MGFVDILLPKESAELILVFCIFPPMSCICFVGEDTNEGENGVTAIISTTSNYISQLTPATEVEYNSRYNTNDIEASQEKYGYYSVLPDYSDDYTVVFRVAESTPSGTEITFNMHITDEDGNEWEDDFIIQVSLSNRQ